MIKHNVYTRKEETTPYVDYYFNKDLTKLTPCDDCGSPIENFTTSLQQNDPLSIFPLLQGWLFSECGEYVVIQEGCDVIQVTYGNIGEKQYVKLAQSLFPQSFPESDNLFI